MSEPNAQTEPDLGQKVADLTRQLDEVKRTVADQGQTLTALVKHTGYVVPTAPVPTPPKPTDPVVVQPPPKPDPKPTDPVVQPPPKPTPAPPVVPSKPIADVLIENAPYILSRVGIVGIVIGLGFAVAYSWEYFGALFKIVAGFAAAGALVAGGEIFSRRKGWGWYGQGITGGGYALAYFVAYAAHNIASVRVIQDPVTDACVLLGLAAAAMIHSVARRSEAMALLSTLLAFGTISLSPLTGFSVIATGVLMVGLATVVIRQRWLTVYGLGTAGSYLTYVLFTSPQVAQLGGGTAGFLLSAGFLAIFWVVWNFVGFRLHILGAGSDSKDGDDLLSVFDAKASKPQFNFGVTLLNGGAFIAAAALAMQNAYPHLFYLLMFGLSAAYFVNALLAKAVKWTENIEVSSFVALALATAGTALKLDTTASIVLWFLEVPLLALIGSRTRVKAFDVFAGLLSAITAATFLTLKLEDGHTVLDLGLFDLSFNVMVAVLGAIALGVTSLLYRGQQRVSDWGLSAAHFLTAAYAVVGLGLIWAVTVQQAPIAVKAVVFALEALAVLFAGQKLASSTVNAVGKFFLASALVGLLASSASVGVVQTAVVLVVTFAVAGLYRSRLFVSFSMNALPTYFVVNLAGIAVGLIMTYLKVDAVWLPLVAALEMVAILGVGLVVRDPVLRLASNVAFALAVLGLFLSFGQWTWVAAIGVVALFYAAYALLRLSKGGDNDAELEQFLTSDIQIPKEVLRIEDLHSAYSLAGTVLLTATLMCLLSWQHLAVALAVEGLLLTVTAFAIRDRQFFLSGMAVFTLLAGKLALYDLYDADAIWRIISLIFAGGVLLTAALVVARFNKMFVTKNEDVVEEKEDGK